MAELVAYFDGLCETWNGRRNPGGCACAGWHIVGGDGVDGWRGHAVVAVGDGATNNVAEYEAALRALRDIYQYGYRGEVTLRGDSQLVVRQFAGEYSCNAPLLRQKLAQLRKAATFFAAVTLVWVPREENDIADAESRVAYETYCRTHRAVGS